MRQPLTSTADSCCPATVAGGACSRRRGCGAGAVAEGGVCGRRRPGARRRQQHVRLRQRLGPGPQPGALRLRRWLSRSGAGCAPMCTSPAPPARVEDRSRLDFGVSFVQCCYRDSDAPQDPAGTRPTSYHGLLLPSLQSRRWRNTCARTRCGRRCASCLGTATTCRRWPRTGRCWRPPPSPRRPTWRTSGCGTLRRGCGSRELVVSRQCLRRAVHEACTAPRTALLLLQWMFTIAATAAGAVYSTCIDATLQSHKGFE